MVEVGSVGLTAVLGRLGEAAGPRAVNDPVLLLLCLCVEWAPVQMVALFDRAVLPALVHAGELRLHFFAGEHGDVFDAERLEDVLLEVVVQFEA